MPNRRPHFQTSEGYTEHDILSALDRVEEALAHLSNVLFDTMPALRRKATNWMWADGVVDRALRDCDTMRQWLEGPTRDD